MRDSDLISNSSSPNYNSSLDLISSPIINQSDPTSVTIEISIAQLGVQPTSYSVIVQKLLSDGITPDGAATEPGPYLINKMLITGLTPESYYSFTITAYVGTQKGNSVRKTIKLTSPSTSQAVYGTQVDPQKLTVGKSFLSLSNLNKSEYTVYTRTFSDLVLPTITYGTYYGPEYITEALKTYSTKYYTFGTSLIMNPSSQNPYPSAAFGFFTNTEATSGYYVLIEPTSSSVVQTRNSVRLVRVDGSDLITLTDSQSSPNTTMDGIFATKIYTIDIKLKITSSQIDITAYVNGFKITATDKSQMYPKYKYRQVLQPTQNISLAVTKGSVLFDYVYAKKIEEPQYKDSNYILNLYQGQFSNDLINASFGDVVYDGLYGDDAVEKRGSIIEEFGTVVREILKVSTKFENRPAYPIRWSTGDNQYAKILSYKMSNFGGEAYVLNNTSVTIPLADGAASNFYIFGNTLGLSGALEYTTEEVSEYAAKEPVIFESKWLQTENDVKLLANWIKEKVVNRGRLITLGIFANPLISIGDVVTIKYPYHGFDGTEKFIVTNISHSYKEGLETVIVCRTL